MPGNASASSEAARKCAAVSRDDLLRGAMQVARAAVVAEPGPVSQHRVQPRARQMPHGRESREKATVVGNHGGDARLLQHDFGDPDGVRIARAAPFEIAFSRGDTTPAAADERPAARRPEQARIR